MSLTVSNDPLTPEYDRLVLEMWPPSEPRPTGELQPADPLVASSAEATSPGS